MGGTAEGAQISRPDQVHGEPDGLSVPSEWAVEGPELASKLLSQGDIGSIVGTLAAEPKGNGNCQLSVLKIVVGDRENPQRLPCLRDSSHGKGAGSHKLGQRVSNLVGKQGRAMQLDARP